MKTFFQSFFQIALVSISTVLITKHLYFGVFVVAFLIYLLWTFNVSRIAVSSIKQKLIYSLGAGTGAVSGLLLTQLLN